MNLRSWKELSFSLRFGGRQIRVQLSHEEEWYRLDEATPLKVMLHGEPYLLSPGTAVVIKRSPP